MAISRGALVTALLALGTSSAAALQDIVVTEDADETVLFQADAVVRQTVDSPIIATGNVRATFGGQLLTAQRVEYDPDSDLVTAYGEVAIYDEDGQVYFADEAQLTGDLADGVATNFSALLAGDSRLAGSSVVRRASGENDLNNAVYTACEVCTEEGDDRTPTWQVKALRVTQDEDDKVIRFRHAFVEVLGVPVFYTPYFQIADPSVDRQSGFLTPNIGTSTRTGFEVEIPYYWAISDYQDITFSPRHLTELGTLLKGEYRLRTHDGGLVVQSGFIDSNDDDVATELDPNAFRWHFFGSAFKELRDDWLMQVDINVVSDKGYLRTYDIEPEGELRDAVDVIQPDRLINELAFTRRLPDSYTDISAIAFQSLRFADDNDFQADALPRITHIQDLEVPGLGGDLEILGNFLYLNRPGGLDTTRGITSLTYERQHTTRGGHRFTGFAQLRGDIYRFEDADLGIESCNTGEGTPSELNRYENCRETLPRNGEDSGFTTARFLPTVGAEWSYPLARLTDGATYILEPRVQVAVSPEKDFSTDVFNEDSQFFQFDTVTLFDWSKASGFDQWEDGQRLNYGLSATAVYPNGLTMSGLVGQQLRIDESNAFDPDTGLGQTTSDLVGNLDIRFGRHFQLDNRFRVDDQDLTLRRAESALRASVGPVSTNLSYLRTETQELGITDERDEFLSAALAYRLTDKWTVGGAWRENLASGETTAQSLLLRYTDQCTIFTVNYKFDNTTGGGFDQNRSLTFNVDFTGF
ncbi:LPS-assembly protein LptD [Parvularcula oceani]|uniref:LPS-assembly protein LptD n=1 Tax=Parvularcula oceani TaxID=1247963 RepID=UPI0004E212D1|nr:LPS assembly protein LptD [Parvularcula oceani]